MIGYADNVLVKEVQSVMNEEWFSTALHQGNIDAILVLGHFDVEDELVGVILSKIRRELGDQMPVQFITGHTHHRGAANPDSASSSFEAGRFLDTVGFASFPTKATLTAFNTTSESNTTDLFHYKFIDGNVASLEATLGVGSLATQEGKALSLFIEKTRKGLGLEERLSCVPRTYVLERPVEENDSLWGLFRDYVVPFYYRNNEVVVLGSGSWRYDLIQGEVRVDDIFGVSPFNDTLYLIPQVESETILKLNKSLNSEVSEGALPNYVFSYAAGFQAEKSHYDLIVTLFSLSTIEAAFGNITSGPTNAVKMNDTTTTGLWLHFFQQNNPCRFSMISYPGVREIMSPQSKSDVARLILVLIVVLTAFAIMLMALIRGGRMVMESFARNDPSSLQALSTNVTEEGLRNYDDEYSDDPGRRLSQDHERNNADAIADAELL